MLSPSRMGPPSKLSFGRTAWAARAALVAATLFIVANALVAFQTSNDVTAAEAAVNDSQAIRLELAALLDKHAALEPGEVDERLVRVSRLITHDPEQQRDLARVRDLARGGAPFPEIRAVVAQMNAREESAVAKREAELRSARGIDATTTLMSLLVGLAFVASLAFLLARRARADLLAAEALRASEERLRMFIEHAPASIAMFDREMRYLIASRRWVKEYALPEKVDGLSVYETVPDLEETWRKIESRVLGGETLGSDLERIERASTVRWLKWELRPWYEAPGKVGGLIAIVDDVTERRRTEEARDRAIEQARHADRLATVGRLAAGVAHEIGTPLSVAAGHAEMIATNEVTGEQAPKSARVIMAQLDRVSKIVRQLLDFSRRRGKGDGVAGKVNVTSVVKRTIELLRSTASKRGIALGTPSLDGSQAYILGEEEAITQVVTNLVMNAIHASHDGGEVTARVTSSDDEVRLEVTDRGTGMSPAVREHIFDPFFTTKSVGDGTGLGLSVVHGIVEDHRGTITVETELGKGATFTVVFPRANDASST